MSSVLLVIGVLGLAVAGAAFTRPARAVLARCASLARANLRDAEFAA